MNKTITFVITLLVPALWGCTGSSNVTEGKEGILSVTSCTARSENKTTVVKDFGMVLLDEGGKDYNSTANPVHVTWLSSGWDFPEIILGEKTCCLYAFYPYMDITGKEMELSLSAQADYLASAAVEVDYSKPGANIEMTHLLSRLNFIVEKSTDCAISIPDYPCKGSYNLETGSLQCMTGTEGILSGSGSILLFPGEIEGYKAEINYDNKTYRYFFQELILEAGKEYNYTLAINKEGNLILSGINIQAWKNGGDYNGVITEK